MVRKATTVVLLVALVMGLLPACTQPAATPTPAAPTSPAAAPATPTAAPAASPTPAAVKPVTLKFAHHLPTIHHHHKNVIVPWAAEVEKRTEGRVKVTVYPAEQLGKSSEMYDLLLNGTADIAMVLPVHHTGRFPLEGVFHLPFLIPGDVTDPTGKVVRDMVYEKYLTPQYFKDVKVLWTGRFSLNVLQMVKKPVRTLEDMKGLVIGFGGGKIMPQMLKAWGASSENVLTGDMYTALERKTIDGQMFPAEGLLAFKLIELVKHVTLVNAGAASHFTAIRMPAWNSLSPADQKIIQEVSTWILEAQAKSWGTETANAIEAGKKAGVEIISLPSQEKQRWVDAVKPVDKAWVAEMDGMGLPGTKIYEDIVQLLPKQ